MIEAVFAAGVDEITVSGLTQWDTGQKLKITLSSLPASFQVHFANKRAETAYVVKGTASGGVATVGIPNVVLQNPADAVAWVYVPSDNGQETVKTINLPITRRSKPSDYAYTEVEILNYETVIRKAESYASAAAASAANAKASEDVVVNIKDEFATRLDQAKNYVDLKANALKAFVKGNPATFWPDEGSSLRPVAVFEPIQPGSGDPYPAGGGKNLCDLALPYTTNNSGTTNAYCSAPNLVPGNTYFVSGKCSDGTALTGNNTAFVIVSTSGSQLWNVSPGYSKVAPDLTDAVNAYLYTTADLAGKTITEFQIELGSVATSYTPYANIRPISGRASATLTRCGKNLCSPAKTTSTNGGVEISTAGDGCYTYKGTATSNAVKVIANMKIPAGTYTLSHTVISGSTTNTDKAVAQFNRVSDNSVLAQTTGNNTKATWTFAEDTEINIRLYVAAEKTYDNWKIAIQLENGSTATTYEPYQGGSFTLDFGQTMCGGSLDWNTGVLTVHQVYKVVNEIPNGTVITPRTNSVRFSVAGNGDFPDGDTSRTNTKCNRLVYRNVYNVDAVGFQVAEKSGGGIIIGLPISVGTTVNEVNAWLTNNPLEFALVLPAPFTVQLEPQQILALDGLNTVYMDAEGLTVGYNKSLNKAFEEALARLAALEAAAVNNA